MRMIIALACVFLSNLALADVVRHSGVPEHFWGKWAPSADLCRDDNGPIYSAHMRCLSLTMPEQTAAALNRIIVPDDSGQLSAGPDFKELKPYHRCLGK
jgi:hypothetical protein